MATTETGATMFLSKMDRPEIVIERVLDTLDSALPGGHAVVSLNDLHVADSDVLGEVGQGLRYAQVRLAPARLTHCMRWTGAARRAHRSEEHTSELQSLMRTSYAVFCLKKKQTKHTYTIITNNNVV